MENIEDEGGGLASTGLRLSDEVLRWVHHQERQSPLLDFRRLSEVPSNDTFEDIFISEDTLLAMESSDKPGMTYKPSSSNDLIE